MVSGNFRNSFIEDYPPEPNKAALFKEDVSQSQTKEEVSQSHIGHRGSRANTSDAQTQTIQNLSRSSFSTLQSEMEAAETYYKAGGDYNPFTPVETKTQPPIANKPQTSVETKKEPKTKDEKHAQDLYEKITDPNTDFSSRMQLVAILAGRAEVGNPFDNKLKEIKKDKNLLKLIQDEALDWKNNKTGRGVKQMGIVILNAFGVKDITATRPPLATMEPSQMSTQNKWSRFKTAAKQAKSGLKARFQGVFHRNVRTQPENVRTFPESSPQHGSISTSPVRTPQSETPQQVMSSHYSEAPEVVRQGVTPYRNIQTGKPLANKEQKPAAQLYREILKDFNQFNNQGAEPKIKLLAKLAIGGDRQAFGCMQDLAKKNRFAQEENEALEKHFEDQNFEADFTIVTQENKRVQVPEKLAIGEKEVTVGRELGQGAFGKVSLAIWNGVKVVVKDVKDIFDDEGIRDLNHEALLHAGLPKHPYVVQCLGVISGSDGVVKPVLEYCDGGDFEKFMEKEKWKTMSVDEKFRIIDEIRQGMAHIISNGLVHRDLAARNILLKTGEDGKLHPKISDFGLARIPQISDDATQERKRGYTESNVGPLKWMAPEAIVRKVYSEKTDVWSFGILVLEVLRGQTPYQDIEAVAAAKQVFLGQLDPITMFNDIPKDMQIPKLKELLTKCLNREPEHRPDFNSFTLAA